MGQWKRFFDKEYLYWPYFLTTLIFTETAIYNIFIYLEIASDLSDISYYQYWPFLIQPMIFLLTVYALTPEKEDKDTAGYFIKRMPAIYGLMAAYIACHFLPGFGVTESLDISRIIGIGLCIFLATSRTVSLVYVITVVWIISLFFR